MTSCTTPFPHSTVEKL